MLELPPIIFLRTPGGGYIWSFLYRGVVGAGGGKKDTKKARVGTEGTHTAPGIPEWWDSHFFGEEGKFFSVEEG